MKTTSMNGTIYGKIDGRERLFRCLRLFYPKIRYLGCFSSSLKMIYWDAAASWTGCLSTFFYIGSLCVRWKPSQSPTRSRKNNGRVYFRVQHRKPWVSEQAEQSRIQSLPFSQCLPLIRARTREKPGAEKERGEREDVDYWQLVKGTGLVHSERCANRTIIMWHSDYTPHPSITHLTFY